MCPVLMSMGMTYDEYWNGDNDAPRMYMKAYRLSRKRTNEDLWLQGLYTYHAVLSLSPALNAASKEFTPEPYLDSPFPLDEEDAKAQREKAQREEAENLARYIKGQSAKAKAARNKKER